MRDKGGFAVFRILTGEKFVREEKLFLSKWLKIKNEVLGKKYDLSVVWAGGKKMAEINARYRQKDYQANTLSFGLSKVEGEIFLNDKGRKNKNSANYLFLHSLLHLKGLGHGVEMEKMENKFAKKFKISIKKFFLEEKQNGATNNNRN